MSGGKSSRKNGRLEANGRRSQNIELRKAKTDRNRKSLVESIWSLGSLRSHGSPVSHGCHGSFKSLGSHRSPVSYW